MSRRRNIYPMDANNPNLRWCKECEYAYMPDSGCVAHVGRCLTCCGFDCRGPVTTVPASPLGTIDPAQVQRDIDALYGPPGGQP